MHGYGRSRCSQDRFQVRSEWIQVQSEELKRDQKNSSMVRVDLGAIRGSRVRSEKIQAQSEKFKCDQRSSDAIKEDSSAIRGIQVQSGKFMGDQRKSLTVRGIY